MGHGEIQLTLHAYLQCIIFSAVLLDCKLNSRTKAYTIIVGCRSACSARWSSHDVYGATATGSGALRRM